MSISTPEDGGLRKLLSGGAGGNEAGALVAPSLREQGKHGGG